MKLKLLLCKVPLFSSSAARLLLGISFVFFFQIAVHAQTTISGVITDARGESLIGASVVVKGTDSGTITDVEGKFSLSVEPGAILIISYTGFVTQEVAASSNVVVTLEEDLKSLGEVVVTGVFDKRTTLESSVAISSLKIDDLRAMVPNSSVDMLKNLPGVYVNSSSGEIGNSVYTRGLSSNSSTRDGSYRYVSMQEDGLPVVGIVGKNSPDFFLRADATIARIEAVRGGSAAILGPNAPGGIFNYISRTGGTEFEGEVAVKGGLEGNGKNPFFRTDFNVGGPLSKDKTWTYNLGGFFRNADGPKYPGYTLSSGGQLKGNILKNYDNGSLKVTMKYLNDRTGPFEYTPTRNFNNPEVVPGFDNTSSLLIQPQRLTMPGSVTGLDEDLTFNAEDGWSFDELAVGLHWDHDLGNGWSTSVNTRISSKESVRNTTAVASPVEVLANGFPFFWAFSGNFFQFGEYEFYNTQTGQSYGSVTQLPPSGGPFPTFVNNGLNLPGSDILENVLLYNPLIYEDVPMTDWISQASITKELDNMSFTAGFYHAYTDIEQVQYISMAASGATYTPQPQAVGIRYTGLDGSQAMATSESGLFGVGGGIFGPQLAEAKINQTAFFLGHSWDLTDKLNLDWGVRMENFSIDQSFVVPDADASDAASTASEATGGIDGDLNTLYDNNQWVLNPRESFSVDIGFGETFSYSAGLNYLISKNLSVYGRYSIGRKTPDLSFYFGNGILDDVEAYDLQPEQITSAELGLKYRTQKVDLFVTPFYSQLSNIPIYLTFQDDTRADLSFYVPELLFKEYNAYGVEVEGRYQFSDNFSIRGVVTLQDSNVPEYETWVEGEGPDDDVRVRFENTENAQIGNMAMITPAYTGDKLRASLNYQFMGERWANELNAFKLPSFHSFDLNVGYEINENFDLALNINNLFNTYGIMAWEGPGDFRDAGNIENLRPEDVAANPNAVFTTQSIMPRAYFLTATWRFK